MRRAETLSAVVSVFCPTQCDASDALSFIESAHWSAFLRYIA